MSDDLPMLDDADADAELIELVTKIGTVEGGLREALERFDACGGIGALGHPEACTCDLCVAIGELRGVVKGLETGRAELERWRIPPAH